MKKLLILALFAAGLCSCSDDKQSSIFVTDIVMPTGIFDPGAEVTIRGSGFEEADDIFVRMSQSILRADVIRAESSSIRFFVPGGLPAGEADILLMRSGEVMVLGSVSLTDGLPPKEYSLYGVGLNLAGETIISRIDFETGAVTRVVTLGETQHLTGIVSAPGTNSIYGVGDSSGERLATWCNLTTKRFGGMERKIITMGILGRDAMGLALLRPGVVMFYRAGYTRNSIGGNDPLSGWVLPENITPEMLTAYPFLSVDDLVLLSARVAAGKYMPLVIEVNEKQRIFPCDAVEADALIPFRLMKSSNGELLSVGGYAVVKQNETVFRSFNPDTIALGEEVFRIPAEVISCSRAAGDKETRCIYLLCRTETGAKKVYTYDLTAEDPQAAFKPLTEEVDFSEIVLAR